jgi:hypothetical protein
MNTNYKTVEGKLRHVEPGMIIRFMPVCGQWLSTGFWVVTSLTKPNKKAGEMLYGLVLERYEGGVTMTNTQLTGNEKVEVLTTKAMAQ